MIEEQMELPLPNVQDDRIYFENLTLTSDTVLARAIGEFEEVFVLGFHQDGVDYRASNGDARFWIYALERAKQWLVTQLG